MNDQLLYFSDNFFSFGKTDIFTEDHVKVGELDLKSAFSASVDILDKSGMKTCSGKFVSFGLKWMVLNSIDEAIGELKSKFTIFTKRYHYNSFANGKYWIESGPFSYTYEIFDEHTSLLGKFDKVSSFFSSPAYRLTLHTDKIPLDEMIAVVMGVNAFEKRKRNAGTNSAT